jgi:hypothetical protein
MDVVYINKWYYEIQGRKEVPVYTGPFRAVSVHIWK